jgi:hypothetical protein
MHMLIALTLAHGALMLAHEAQHVPPQPAEPAPAVSLDRIRRGLEEPPSTVTVSSTDPTLPPVFRMEIKQRPLPYEHLWDGDFVSAHVRPVRGLTHHEFLEQVTPDLFRSTSMYPCCPVLPLLAKLRKSGPDKNAEAKARLQVKKELHELLESNKRSASANQTPR